MTIRKILSHPLLQLIAFCIILVGSPYFGGPYVYFLYHAVREALPYAIIGWIGIAITISGLFFRSKRENVLQFIGAAIMVVSLLVFFFSSENFMNMYAFKEVLPLMTLLLFALVVAFVFQKFIKGGAK